MRSLFRPFPQFCGRSFLILLMSERLNAANAQLMRLREQRGITKPAEDQPSPWLRSLCLRVDAGPTPLPAPAPSFSIDPQAELVIYPHALINSVKIQQPTGWLAWKLARQADQKGQGWIDRSWLQTYLSKHLEVGPEQALRILKKAIGVFFHSNSTQSRLFYAQPGIVAARLGCEKMAAHSLSMKLDTFSSFKEIRRAAYLCALTLWSSAEKPLSRAHIERLTSISTRTQREYDREFNKDTCERFHAFVHLSKKDHCPKELAAKFGNAVRTKADSDQIRIQLPNCFVSHVGRYGRGRSARARRQFKQAMLREIPSIRPMAIFEQTSRRFYPSALAAFKSAERGDNTLSPIVTKQTKYKLFLAFNVTAYKR